MSEKYVLSMVIDEEIALRLVEARHTDAYYALINRNREYLRQWMGWVDHETAPETTGEFLHQRLMQFANNQCLQMGIWYRGKMVGSIALNAINWSARKTEIGYWLDAGMQGRGIMTRACRALTTYAFEEYDLHKVEIHCATGNTQSRAIPERLGFKQEGIIRDGEWLYDHYVDIVIYGIMEDEWQR